MDYTVLGGTGLRVSRLGIGTAVLGLVPPEEGVDALIHAALDSGINLFDCANTYGNRPSMDRAGMPDAAHRKHAEELLGKALRGHRDDVVLCTKVSEPIGSGPNDGGFGIEGFGTRGGGLSRYHIMREVERSLNRLGTDRIDIYHMHHPDFDTRIEESLAAMDSLVQQGKIRYVGLSTFAAWEMTQAVMTADCRGLSRPILNQVAYNMLNRGAEAELVPAALDLGLGLTCYSPLAGGALAGTKVMSRPYSGVKRWGADVDYSVPQKQAAADLETLSMEWGYSPAHLALHWLYTRPALSSAIIGPETPAELEQNLGSLDVVLDDEQEARLNMVGVDVAPSRF